jgi:beta-galactosidase
MKLIRGIYIILLVAGSLARTFSQPVHSFTIKGGDFIYDGTPIMIHSGEMHYERIPRPYWKQRLEMLKAMGMNTVATYVFWNYHETAPGEWNFSSGNRDITSFIRTAQQVGLFVILRPGPYACAEWEFGGFPWWLPGNANLKLRTDNAPYLDSCRVYIDHLANEIRDLQITHGGPIIMLQVENEYGSYVEQKHIPLTIEKAYMQSIEKDLRNAGIDVPLFTADGSWLFKQGSVTGVLPAANGEDDVDKLTKAVNTYHDGKGPYMVSEFYPGWLDHWGEPFQKVSASEIVNQLDSYLKDGISFNFYMAHGGTNFGFMSGANYDEKHSIQPDITSYDYNAPITEAGWTTPKFMAIRMEMARYMKMPLASIPPAFPVIAISPVQVHYVADFFDLIRNMQPVICDTPMTFEDLHQGYGYVWYRKRIIQAIHGMLNIPGLSDYAIVYINGKRVGVLNRMENRFSLKVTIPANSVLDIFVENMGRINYGAEITQNSKGIVGRVTINGTDLKGNWLHYRFPFDSAFSLRDYQNSGKAYHPAIYFGSFELHKTGDTFLDMRHWGKGIVWVNGHNLGKYWNIGPQQTLFLPGCWLRKGRNDIQIFEELNNHIHRYLTSLEAPILDSLEIKQE